MRFFLFFVGILTGSVQASEENLPVRLDDGTVLQGKIRLPEIKSGKKTKRDKIPLILLFGGFQEASRVLTLIDPPFPVILASFDYPFDPPRKFIFPASLKFAPQGRKMVFDTIRGIGVFCRAVVEKYPQTDPDRVILIGASVGAPFAVWAGSGDSAFRAVILVHGFGKLKETAQHNILRSWKNKYWIFTRPLAGLLVWLGSWYLGASPPEEAAVRFSAAQRVLMISATEDSFVPAEASDALWRGIQKSQAISQRIVLPGDHLQPGAGNQIKRLMEMSIHWLQEQYIL